jgi:tRNA(Ile)-lysidine synthase
MVAFSGGGDSLALLLAAKAWADGAGRRLVALTVDHQIQGAGAAWAAWCRDRAKRLGVAHETLTWRGAKPRTGMAAAARAARHSLVAEAARAAGAGVVLMGHTEDDCMEAAAMRAQGTRVSAPRVFAPSPVWPAGRGIFLLRPLLQVRRAAIRDALTRARERWIEDPANVDTRQPRARARAGMKREQAVNSAPDLDIGPLFRALRFGAAGDIELPVEALAYSSPEAARAMLSAALVCVGGQDRTPRRERLDRVAAFVAAGDPFIATLAGARLSLADGRLRIAREIGDRRKGTACEMALPEARAVVWDGRFEILARRPGFRVQPLAGLASRLEPASRSKLRTVARKARAGLPAIVDEAGKVNCPTLTPMGGIEVNCLVKARMAGACGMITDEASIRRVAESDAAS